MNNRKPVKALDHEDVRALQHIWHEARRLRLPLNVFLSAKPDTVDAMSVEERCALWDRLKNLYGEFARRHHFPITFLWVRESLPDGSKEHLHMLCHVPRLHRAGFIALAMAWLPGAHEMDVRPASQAPRLYANGKVGSVLGYLIKNMTPQAAYGRNRIRKKGGPVVGKMWGCSRNLKARLAVS